MIDQILRDKGFELKRKTSKEYSSPCPFCGGVDRFCIWPEDNKAHCIRGCKWKGDDIQLLRDLENMSFKEAKEAVGRPDKGDKPKPSRKSNKSNKPFIHPELGKPDEIYNYTDETGKLLSHVCRYDPKSEGGKKDFRQCKPDGITWSTKGVRQVLYNLPEITKAQDIFFSEGERDTKALKKLGFAATCNLGGAGKLSGQQEKHKILDPLKGKRVFILPDNDEPGRKHSDELANLLFSIAKTIKVINLPGLSENGDVSDFIDIEGADAKHRLIEEVTSAPIWTPPKAYYTLQDLCDIPADNHIPIIDSGILPYNAHALIAGESGVGKSLLRDEIAIHIAMGWDWMGFKIPRARSVAIIQYENSEHTENFRIQRMLKGLGTTIRAVGDRIKFAKRDERFNLSLKGDRVKLMQRVKDLGCEVIIYDCLSNLHTSNENDNIKMREVLDIFTDINAQLKTSCIVIHHFGKPGENPRENQYRVRGAISIMDWAYTVITMTRKPHEEKTLRKIEFVKVRDAKEPKPFYIERDEETFLSKFYDEDSLVPPNLIYTILDDQFNGAVDKQKDLINAIMERTRCAEKTAKRGIKKAVEMKNIYEYQVEKSRAKGYRIPMSGKVE